MSKDIKVRVSTMDGEKRGVETPTDVRVDEFIKELCDALNLPKTDFAGNPVVWRIDDKDTDRTLDGLKVLESQGVKEGHRLSLIRATVAGCFPETTQVLLATGNTEAIGRIKSGDSILAYDMYTCSYLSSPVEGIYQQTYSEKLIFNNQLTTTADQHLLLANRCGWRQADDIKIGDVLLKFPFVEAKITDIQMEKIPISMFSLTLRYPRCLIVDGFVARDLIGKQQFLPRAVDVFLSSAVADKDEAKIILDTLEKEERTVFWAEKNIDAGDNWEKGIKEALRNCRNFWILVTPNSLHSEWVITEWATAWALDKKIVPILFRCRPEDLPKRLQSYQCVDFHQIEKAVRSIQKVN